MPFRSHQSAQVVHQELRAAVHQFKTAEHNVVVWFGEMKRRKLYREFGCGSMRQYAVRELGFSETRAGDFGRLADRLEVLPQIRASVEKGELGYTKAREIVSVASPETEEEWLRTARESSRRQLEERARKVKRQAKRRRQAALSGQAELLPAAEPGGCTDGRAGGRAGDRAGEQRADDRLADAVPSSVSLRMTAEQRARYEALWAALGVVANAEDVLRALDAMLSSVKAGREVTASDRSSDQAPDQVDTHKTAPRGASRPPVQIHVHQCPECGAMTAAGRPLDAADRERVQCDAAIAEPGRRNTTTIAPRVRLDVLARDSHRCQSPGCNHRQFLEIHHLVPRSKGGTNDPDNLITLCSACHRLRHTAGALQLVKQRDVRVAMRVGGRRLRAEPASPVFIVTDQPTGSSRCDGP